MKEGLFHLFATRLRLSEPWRFKLPLIMTMVYLSLYQGGASLERAAATVAWSLCTAVGVAGLAYLSNEVADRGSDARSGRRNGTVGLSAPRLALLAALGATAAFVPWRVHFPVDAVSAGLLSLELLLLAAYSAPPLRLKERGFAGVVTDALYAHVVPTLLATYTIGRVVGIDASPIALLSLVTWQFALGVRNILQHQLADLGRDATAGSATFAVRAGHEATERLLRGLVVPLELASGVAWVAIAARSIPFVAVALGAHLTLTAMKIGLRWRLPLFTPMNDRLHLFVDTFVLRWLPLSVLAAMVMRDVRTAPLILLHIAIFPNDVADLAVARVRAAFSLRPGPQ